MEIKIRLVEFKPILRVRCDRPKATASVLRDRRNQTVELSLGLCVTLELLCRLTLDVARSSAPHQPTGSQHEWETNPGMAAQILDPSCLIVFNLV
jgi:hypothetical protein